MAVLYNLLLLILSPFWVPWMLWRSSRRKESPNWRERFGRYSFGPRKDGKRIWIHAVSVGEVVAVLPILREVRKLLPDHEIILSVTTSSGHQTAREKAEGLFDHLVYFPIDLMRFQFNAMMRVQPAVVAVMETELWMSFLWQAKAFRASTLLINGRISDRSFPRSQKIAFFYRPLLGYVDHCLMQSEVDAERIKALGGQNVEVLGNCKFDEAVEGLDANAAEWRRELKLPDGKPVLVIGSTRGEMEEKFVLEAIASVGLDRVSVVHAPRHMERVPALAEQVQAAFGSVALRSKGEGGSYVLLDTYGELSKVYSVADIVVVGGGFDNLGGQNILQPLAHGKPVLHGPHMQNFRAVADAAQAAGASQTCGSPEELAAAINELLEDSVKRESMGAAAAKLVQGNLGASERYARVIIDAACDGGVSH
ncbi:MAG: hypothetical protein KF784_04235 [Fimbriimonadaceae bacterium]|nr:hypothetical protein [Fimbriimonadaceae bacterium]